MMKRTLRALAVLCMLAPGAALAQSGPHWPQGYVPPPTGTNSWESTWESKMDAAGGHLTGGTIDGAVIGGATPAAGSFTSILGDISGASIRPTGAPIARTLASRLSETVDLRDYGAVCDGVTDDAAAFNAALAGAVASTRLSGANVIIPAGVCYIGSTAAVTVPAGKSISIAGDGTDVSFIKVAPNVDGIAINLGQLSGASVSGLTIQRTASHATGNTALAITETSTKSGAVDVRRVYTLSDNYPGSWANGIVLTSTSSAAVDNIYTVAGFPPESSNGLVIKGINSNFAVDTHISNVWTQGGNVGLLVTGYVQGIYVTNLTAIAGNYGVQWTDGLANPQYVSELLLINNAHLNSYKADAQVWGNSLQLSNSFLWRWGDGQSDSTPWTAVELKSGTGTISNCLVNDTSNGVVSGQEYFVHLIDSSATTIEGNSVLTINGPGVEFDGNSALNVVTGNNFNNMKAGVTDNTTNANNLVVANSFSGVNDISTTANVTQFAYPIASAGTVSAGNSTAATVSISHSLFGWNCSQSQGEACILNQGGAAPTGSQGFAVYQATSANLFSSATKILGITKGGDLTASGGIDGTAIGATSPSTGNFTSLNATGGLSLNNSIGSSTTDLSHDINLYGGNLGMNIVGGGQLDVVSNYAGGSIVDVINAASVTTTTSSGLAVAGYVDRSAQDGLAAAGTTQGTATALSKVVNRITACASGAGLLLPSGAASGLSRDIIVLNRSGAACLVYPNSGGAIEAGAANASVSVASGADVTFRSMSPTAWVQ